MRAQRFVAFGVGLALTAALASAAQQLYIGESSPVAPRWAKASDFDGSILFCRAYYDSDRPSESSNGFWTDYPGGDHNFLVRLSELSEVRVRFSDTRIPFYVIVRLDDPLLTKCPIVFMSGAGGLALKESEVDGLRAYLLKGGTLWSDDFWGDAAWDVFNAQMRRVLRPALYPWYNLTPTHPVFHMLYAVPYPVAQVSNADFWNGTHLTSELGEESATVHFVGIDDEKGRTMVFATHNTDIGDGFEEEKPVNFEYLNQFSAKCYALGINIFLYALTH